MIEVRGVNGSTDGTTVEVVAVRADLELPARTAAERYGYRAPGPIVRVHRVDAGVERLPRMQLFLRALRMERIGEERTPHDSSCGLWAEPEGGVAPTLVTLPPDPPGKRAP